MLTTGQQSISFQCIRWRCIHVCTLWCWGWDPAKPISQCLVAPCYVLPVGSIGGRPHRGREVDSSSLLPVLSGKWKWKSLSPADPSWPHRLHSSWSSLDQNTGVGSCYLLQGIFPTQGSNPGLLHCRQILYSWATREAHLPSNSSHKQQHFLLVPPDGCSLDVLLHSLSQSPFTPWDGEPISWCSRLGRQNNIFWTFSSVASTIKVADISQHPWYLHVFSLDFFFNFFAFSVHKFMINYSSYTKSSILKWSLWFLIPYWILSDTILMVKWWLPQIQFHFFTQQYPMTRIEFSFSVLLKKEEIFSRGHHAQIF